MKTLLFLLLVTMASQTLQAQACTPAGDETSYGTGDTWIGYVYDNMGFTSYAGSVTEGASGNPNFDESFGGDYVNYATNGCPVYTETFSVRYKLQKTFAAGNYQITVGADDGFRLSIDGGATWVINRWGDQSYTSSSYSANFSGTYNLVLEYYENGGGNRVSFTVATACVGTENTSVYGTGNIWKGYIYAGMNFNMYAGMVTEGSAPNPNFDENYGGSNTVYSTSACGVTTEQFSARYRLQKNFAPGTYSFIVGGDDGFRLSLDGGVTWVINQWWDQGYNTAAYNTALSGTVNMVLEFYENGGNNRLSFAISGLLPAILTSFQGSTAENGNLLQWTVTAEQNIDYYQLEKSSNAIDFTSVGKLTAGSGTGTVAKAYSFVDPMPFTGTNYYRLRMVDKDGSFNYSPVIKLTATGNKAISFFPALLQHQPLFLKSSVLLKNASIEVYDITGRTLQVVKLPSDLNAGQTINLPLKQLSAGTYIVICKTAGKIATQQMIVVSQ